MSYRWIYILVVVVLLVGAGYLYSRSLPGSSGNTALTAIPTPTVSEAPSSAQVTPQTGSTVTITSAGFNPTNITIKAGDTITWTNSDTNTHQVNSNPHPIHTDYLPLNTVGQIQPGESKSLTFPKAGTYGYHDHLNPQFKGTVTVE